MRITHEYGLLSRSRIRAVETSCFAQGHDSYALMRLAGIAVADIACDRYPGCDFLVLAGPGNNGGDGFVAAQALLERGKEVCVASVSGPRGLTGDAARAAQDYKGGIVPFEKAALAGNPVIIDALFGIGLERVVKGKAAALIGEVNARGLDVVAVDMPSGVQSDTGAAMGVAIKANVTVTFIRRKYGHLLMPGRVLSGEVIVEDLGMAVEEETMNVRENRPELWRAQLPWPSPEQHKYDRGHTLVIGGEMKRAGAAKMAAMAALRTGSGAVSIVCRAGDVPVYAASALGLMTETRDHWSKLLADARRNAVLIGPGAGVGKPTRDLVLAALKAKKCTVLDADALTSFADSPKILFEAIQSPCILTPHAGEFAKLFPGLVPSSTHSKLEAALKAAAVSGAVVIYKGYDTVIAAPDGRAAINTNAPPDLATAGAGDVLSGICAGLLAQGMEPFEAASAAVWMHGEAALQQGAGLIAEDLPRRLPSVLQALKITS